MVDKTVLEKIKDDPLVKLAGKSAFFRNAVNEYVERKEIEKRESKNEEGEK